MNDKMNSFEEAARPIQKWFRENCSSHDRVIIDWNMAYLLEGSMGITSGWLDLEEAQKDV
ncbi:hypothetical protein ACTNDY_06620 [Tissierellaceae bacterium HCP3S3_D8]